MGWLKIGAREAAQQASCGDLKPSSQHLENVATDSNLQPRYSFAPKESPDADLQFISAKEISKRVSPETGGLRKPLSLNTSQTVLTGTQLLL